MLNNHTIIGANIYSIRSINIKTEVNAPDATPCINGISPIFNSLLNESLTALYVLNNPNTYMIINITMPNDISIFS